MKTLLLALIVLFAVVTNVSGESAKIIKSEGDYIIVQNCDGSISTLKVYPKPQPKIIEVVTIESSCAQIERLSAQLAEAESKTKEVKESLDFQRAVNESLQDRVEREKHNNTAEVAIAVICTFIVTLFFGFFIMAMADNCW